MKEQVISVTMAARMFADCVNRVRYQGVSFLLQKNGVSVARIVPVDPVSGMNLADVVAPLAKTPHPGSDRVKAPPQPAGKSSMETATSEDAGQHPAQHRDPQPKPMLNW